MHTKLFTIKDKFFSISVSEAFFSVGTSSQKHFRVADLPRTFFPKVLYEWICKRFNVVVIFLEDHQNGIL